MERDPLLEPINSTGLVYQSKKSADQVKTVALVILAVVCVGLLAGVIAEAILLAKTSKSPKSPFPVPTPDKKVIHPSNNFPLYPASAWDINANHSRPLQFTTNEGTWMSLDLSPDGKTIVFDMLGDIYTVPVEGGKATPLLTGVAWEWQPRFSPDGSSISFTSDASGCDNIWVYHLTTKQRQQVTFEPYHFANNAKWLNSSYLIVNHWRLSGARGVAGGTIAGFNVPPWDQKFDWGDSPAKNPGQVFVGLSNPNAQFGPEEPEPYAGRYVFYSRNMVDSVSWAYNKDPHSGIYAIIRYDLQTKSQQTIVGGPGGAARPVISRDGTKLAFIKRTLFNTTLMIYEFATDNTYQLNNLNYQDQQESYAPSGVYPNFAWTPDSTAIIAWAGGKFIRIPVSGGASTNIPFSIDANLMLAPTVLYPQNVAYNHDSTSTFQTKVALNPFKSSNGNLLAFSAIGSIYTLDLITNGAKPQLVTAENARINYFWPALNSDNSLLVRTAWSDELMGWIEVVNMQTKATTTITSKPGRYLRPTFSSDNSRILYTKTAGDAASGGRNTMATGVYVTYVQKDGTPVAGKKEIFVTGGGEAYWSPVNPDEIFVVQSSSYPYTLSRYSVAEDSMGKLIQSTITSLYGTAVAFSQDMNLVAWVEFEVLYVMKFPLNIDWSADDEFPFELTSRPAQADKKITQVQTITYLGADFLQFDGFKLSYGWANSYTTVDLSSMATEGWSCPDQYCFLQPGKNQFAKVWSTSVQHATSVSQSTFIAFTNAALLTMNDGSNDPLLNQKLIVQGDKIVNFGPMDTTETPVGAMEVDLQGGFVLPGFIDVHAHWGTAFPTPWGKTVQGWEFLSNLKFGVTTLHNPSSEYWSVFTDAELIQSGKKIGPRIFTTSKVMFGPGGDYHCEIGNLDDALNALTRRKLFGAQSVKSYIQGCRAARQKVLQAGRILKMNVVPEGGMHTEWDLNMFVDGHTTVEHCLPIAPFFNDILTLFAQAGTGWTPTMIVSYGGIMGENYFYQVEKVFEDPFVTQYVPNEDIRPRTMRRMEADVRDHHVFTVAKAVANVSSAGGRVNVGAHGQLQGLGYLWELKFFEAGGMSNGNYDVLRAATINGAKSMGYDQQIGSITAGKLADLVILRPGDNPLNSLDVLRNIKWIMINGHVYDANDFSQVYPTPLPPPILTQINDPILGTN